jgi:hypothetical protein
VEFDLNDPSTYRSTLSRPICLYETTDVIEAYLIRDSLERSEIRTVVMETLLGFTDIVLLKPTSVWVAEEDLDRARLILEAIRSHRARDKDCDPVVPAWTCAECGEEVEGEFEICWNCEHDRPNR